MRTNAGRKPVQELSGQTCRICGDRVETVNKDGFVKRKLVIEGDEPFVACNECAFPVCMTCYRYERREGLQVCPRCKTRYKRHRGCPRVEGDDEEEDFDDLEKEFASDYDEGDAHDDAEAMLYDKFNVTGSNDAEVPHQPLKRIPEGVLLLTYHQEDSEIPSDHYALIIPPILHRAKRVHPVAIPDTSSFQPRLMDPKKDLALYGYVSVAWKDQIKDSKMVKHQGGNNQNPDGDEPDGPDFPKTDEGRQPLSRKLFHPAKLIHTD